MPIASKHIIVGISGGVDSSVAALLLSQQGYKVTAVFMQNWNSDDIHCQAHQDLSDAKAVCNKLGISLTTVNFAQEYWDLVFQYFLDELSAGRTPNPDIFCNQEIKFKAFLNYALEIGAEAIATGHYAYIRQVQDLCYLERAADHNKDQSYFLHRLNQYQLKHSLFPLGQLTKTTVRAIAQKASLINHAKKDSTGICFIGERKFKAFLSEYLLAQPGPIKTEDGNIIGEHQGLMFYTLGQRQGLGIGGHKKYGQAPWYVLEKEVNSNTLIVGQQIQHPKLFKQSLLCHDVNWIIPWREWPLVCTAKIRYRQDDQPCMVTHLENGQFRVQFDTAQRAITPGQAVVFYRDTVCLGGGIIIE